MPKKEIRGSRDEPYLWFKFFKDFHTTIVLGNGLFFVYFQNAQYSHADKQRNCHCDQYDPYQATGFMLGGLLKIPQALEILVP